MHIFICLWFPCCWPSTLFISRGKQRDIVSQVHLFKDQYSKTSFIQKVFLAGFAVNSHRGGRGEPRIREASLARALIPAVGKPQP